MGLVKWFFKPFSEFIDAVKQPVEQEITPVVLPSFCLKDAPAVKTYRPTSFSDYIGQEKAKKTLMAYMTGVKSRNMPFPHTLIHGNAGCGKTTLARIIANELKIPIQETISSEIKQSYDIVCKLYGFQGKSGIIFLDEVHALERGIVEGLYPVMEDFQYQNQQLPPFTLIGATTELGEILKSKRPFIERFKLWIELEPYKREDIVEIIKRYRFKMFPVDKVSDSILEVIGENARNTPRTGIRLLEATIYSNGDIDKVLTNNNIISEGYTNRDLKCLKYLQENDKGVGLQGLCSYLNISQELYMYEIEPYMLQNNMIIRTPRGRKITALGIAKMQELSLIT